MTDNPSSDELLEQGIQAAKSNDPVTARRLFEQVLETDQQNEKAWLWLAIVINDVQEQRVCLNNVLLINPGNQHATALLQKLDRDKTGDTDETVASQSPPPRRPRQHGSKQTLLIASMIAASFVLLASIWYIVFGSGDDTDDPDTSAIGVAVPSPATSQTAPDPPATIVPLTATAPPPTWTPIPSSTPNLGVIATVLPAPPETLPGTIILESGNVLGDPRNRPIALMKANGSGRRVLTDSGRGHSPVLSPDGSQYAYIQFLSGTREEILVLDNIQGTALRNISTYWKDAVRLFEPDTPAWSADGNWIAFSAVGMGAVLPDLYRVLVVPTEGNRPTLERLTTDDIIESWPAFSPDSTRIVYVADKSRIDFGNPVDLSIYDLTTETITDITTNGAEIIESAPDWSPDGQYIIFGGVSAGSNISDIYRVPISGLGTPQKIIESDADDIRPRYSPNGQYIVFSSNRTGNWDLFVYDIFNNNTYQLTSDPQTDIAGDWGR